ncbi:Uncharacterised protein [Burkholderia pseudomallei]|nr:Uncharacterised protein [Burkholderia pseudomallei]
MPGCVKWLHGYGLKMIWLVSHSSPRWLSTAFGSARSPHHAWKKPNRPSSAVGGAVTPAAANSAALTPACAAQPQCTRLTEPPVRFASSRPAPMLAAMPSADAIPAASSPYSIAAAAAAPSVPQIDVACWPRSKNTELPSRSLYAATPSRMQISVPTVIASSSAAPDAFVASATASAAGITDALGCSTDSMCESSKSIACASVPFTSAASAAGNRSRAPTTPAGPRAAQPRATRSTACATDSRCAIRLLPSRSSTRAAASTRSCRSSPSVRTAAAKRPSAPTMPSAGGVATGAARRAAARTMVRSASLMTGLRSNAGCPRARA